MLKKLLFIKLLFIAFGLLPAQQNNDIVIDMNNCIMVKPKSFKPKIETIGWIVNLTNEVITIYSTDIPRFAAKKVDISADFFPSFILPKTDKKNIDIMIIEVNGSKIIRECNIESEQLLLEMQKNGRAPEYGPRNPYNPHCIIS